MIIDELVALFKIDYRGKGEARQFADDLQNAERAAGSFADGLLKMGAAITAALAGLAIGDKISGFVNDITTAGRTFENFQTQLLTAFSGDDGKAKAAFAWIEDFAAISPEGINEVTAAFVKLQAYGLDPTSGILESIGNTAAGMGKSTDQGVEAIADAVTGEFERLKEFAGIKAKQTNKDVTFAWSEGGKQRTLTVKKNAEDIQRGLQQIMTRFDGAMDRQSKTFDGIISKIEDRWQQFLRKISRSGYYDALKQRLSLVADTLDSWAKSGTLDVIAKQISDGLVAAINTAEHLGTQVWRIGKGFYAAADGVVTLIARMNGLGKTATALGIGGGFIASSALGRRAALALARRIPAVAAFILVDEIIGAFHGDDSVLGSLDGAQEAIANIKQSFQQMMDAADGFAATLNGLFGTNKLLGETNLDALGRSLKGFASTEVVRFMNELAQAIKDIASGIKLVSGVLKNPAAAWKKFVDAAIAQIDRLVRAVDAKLGGALTRFGIIPNPNEVAKEARNKRLETTGSAPRAVDQRTNYTPAAKLELAGRQQAEGIGAEFGIDPDRLAAGAAWLVKATLDVTQMLSSGNAAKAMMLDLARGFTARADLDLSTFNAKAAQAQATLDQLRNGLGSVGSPSSMIGRSAVAPRALVTASPGDR